LDFLYFIFIQSTSCGRTEAVVTEQILFGDCLCMVTLMATSWENK